MRPGLIALSLLFLAACGRAPPATVAVPPSTPKALTEHSEEFRPQLLKAADGVYVAIGYGIANSIMIEGEDGLIIVDTMESAQAAQQVLAQFRTVSRKPIKAIVYTHSHPDHIGGAAVFAPPGSGIPVYAQQDVSRNMDKTAAELRAAITRRSLRMYGTALPQGERINIGIGGFLALNAESELATLRPTRTFDDQLEDTVAGVHFQLVHAPGETADQLYMWLPERGVLLAGDNFYRSFPNLYTIRGTSYRDPKLWAQSLDRMRGLHARVLVPSHTKPLEGEAAISAALTDYRDAIRYVYDQSVRMINRGLTPDEIAAQFKLPEHLARSPYLQPFYGKPSWSARSVFSGMLGWYSGDPGDLQPLAPEAQAQRMVALAGGTEAMDRQIQAAITRQDWQWALQLSGYALRVNAGDEPARQARTRALRELGAAEANAPARDWYFMAAHELAGEITVPSREANPTPAMLAAMPLSIFFDGMAVNLHAEDCLDRSIRTGFEFSDSQARYTYIVRRGVSEVVPGIADDVDLRVRVSEQVFKEALAGLRNPALSVARDFEVVKGSKLEFARFMQLFQPE